MAAAGNRKIKIACPGCGQKLDVTEMPAFARISCPACELPLIVPKWFNNYLLEEPEGKGGMATVYRALDVALDREVAIKIFDPDLASRGVSPNLFLHEARIAATVNHPAVVPIYSCGEWDGAAYIVMQYMGGGTLERRLKNSGGRLPVMETCRWIRDVCEGLECALENRVIHHDVKPANMLLDLESGVKISDFGLSQVISGSSASSFLDASTMWLSPQYVSPEKVLTGDEGPKGDVYSLGASFYHLLTGQLPFQDDDMKKLVQMRTDSDPVSPDLVRPEITPAIALLVLDMMKRDPDARPSYQAIINRINDALRAIMRTAPAPTTSSIPVAPPPDAPVIDRKAKILHIPQEEPVEAPPPKILRVSRLPLLLILFFLACTLCTLVFLPRFVDLRKLLNSAPALAVLYGDLPPESFPFLTESFFADPAVEAKQAFSDYNLPLDVRYAAAWTASAYELLGAVSSAPTSAADMGDHLRSAASRAGVPPPAADAYCLAVLSRLDPNPPKVYFSSEQLARVHLGRLLRLLFDLDPSVLDHGRAPDSLLREFATFKESFRALPKESWLRRLFEPRIPDWEAALCGNPDAAVRLEPVFLRSVSARNPASGSRQTNSPSTIRSSPFGSVSRITGSGSGD